MTEERINILTVADTITSGDRNKMYGHPLDNFQATADILKVLIKVRYNLDVPITPDFVGLVMAVAVKGAREAYKPHQDNLIDGAGYFRTIEMCHEEAAKRSKLENERSGSITRVPEGTPFPSSGGKVFSRN